MAIFAPNKRLPRSATLTDYNEYNEYNDYNEYNEYKDSDLDLG